MQILPWQQADLNFFKRSFTQGTLPHALLLHGAKGIGKLHFAQYLSHVLLCRQHNQSIDVDICGSCTACQLMAAGNHPDLRLLDSTQDNKSIVTIDQVREVNEFLWLTPHVSQRKVVIISVAEHMNMAAANGFLKTLEEPPPGCVLLLVSHNIAAIIATIRSRCQLFRFNLPEHDLAKTWLSQQLDDTASEQSHGLLALAGGAPLLALQHQQSNVIVTRNQLFDVIDALQNNQENLMTAANTLSKLDIKVILYWLASLIIDIIRIKAVSKPPGLVNVDVLEKLQRLSQCFDLKRLLAFQDKILSMKKSMSNNVNAQLMVEALLLDWVALSRV